MNVGLFTDSYYPEVNGVATSVLTLKKELEQLGHRVYVFTTTSPGAPLHEHNVFRVPSLPCILITERRVGLFYQMKLASLIKKLNLDIIHTNTEFSLGIFGRIMAKELGVPMVHTYHTIYEDYTHYVTSIKTIDKRAKSFARIFSRVCCNTVEQVIVPTTKVKDLLLRYNVNRKITVVPTGVDLEKFNPTVFSQEDVNEIKFEHGISLEDKVILYIGRISKEKNIAYMIGNLSQYFKSREQIKFVLIGSGPELLNLKALVKELEIEDKILFLGSKPWDQIGLYYQMGDVFVSASNSETQGLTYIEAMASGLCVVAKEDDCLQDILIEGYNGYSFRNKEELIEKLDKVLFNSQDYPYGKNARILMDKYSTKEFGKNISSVYQEVMDKNQVEIKQVVREQKKIFKIF